MIEIKCTEKEKNRIIRVLANSSVCYLGKNDCKLDEFSCDDCVNEHTKWVITKDPPPLKSCPFCGGKAVEHIGYFNYVRCDNCLIGTISYDTLAEAIEAWNGRTV